MGLLNLLLALAGVVLGSGYDQKFWLEPLPRCGERGEFGHVPFEQGWGKGSDGLGEAGLELRGWRDQAGKPLALLPGPAQEQEMQPGGRGQRWALGLDPGSVPPAP